MRAAPAATLAYPAGVASWLRRRLKGDGPRLVLSQSLGAFGRPGEQISPLYVFFEVANDGERTVEMTRIYVGVKGEAGPVYEGPFEKDSELPGALASGESARFWTRAKALAASLKRAGHDGRPRARFVVEDAEGNLNEKIFRFRVDEYLELRDE